MNRPDYITDCFYNLQIDVSDLNQQRVYFPLSDVLQGKVIQSIFWIDTDITARAPDALQLNLANNLLLTLYDDVGFSFVRSVPVRYFGNFGSNCLPIFFSPGRVVDWQNSFFELASSGTLHPRYCMAVNYIQ